MFEKASRLKLRFTSPKGPITVEDLWDLPLTSSTGKANLDDLARALHQQLESQNIGSFVLTVSPNNALEQLKFDLVVHVIKVRLAENEAARKLAVAREKKQQIMEIISRKETESLSNASLDDLRAMLSSL